MPVQKLIRPSLVTMVALLNEVLTGTERVLDTPLPTAYSIAIAQISWIYVLVLPFQLYGNLGWITIPASIGKDHFNVQAPSESSFLTTPS